MIALCSLNDGSGRKNPPRIILISAVGVVRRKGCVLRLVRPFCHIEKSYESNDLDVFVGIHRKNEGPSNRVVRENQCVLEVQQGGL